MQLELAVRVLIGWTAASVLAAVAWSRFATRMRQREQELDGVPPRPAQPLGGSSVASNRAEGGVADQGQLPRSA